MSCDDDETMDFARLPLRGWGKDSILFSIIISYGAFSLVRFELLCEVQTFSGSSNFHILVS